VQNADLEPLIHILLLDRGGPTRARLLTVLDQAGHVLRTATSLIGARRQIESQPIDLVVLDRDLPDGDGLALARELRRAGDQRPIIAAATRDTVADRVEGLRAGLDDYVGRDIDSEELCARIEAIGRRSGLGEDVAIGPLHIDASTHRVHLDGSEVELTAREFELLLALARSSPQARSRAELLDEVWGERGPATSNLVDVYVRYLRTKLQVDLIRTVRGVGYALDLTRVEARRSRQEAS
jgi:DNA-binding response OmpR family regulator